jgi:zinc protease
MNAQRGVFRTVLARDLFSGNLCRRDLLARSLCPVLLFTVVLLSLAVFPPVLAGPAGAVTPRHPHELKPTPLAFAPLTVQRDTLACGIPVLLFENHDLPICDLTIRFHMGTRYLSLQDHTAIGLFGSLWRDGGTTSISPDSLDGLLTALDASVWASISDRTGQVSLSLSSEDVERALPLWRDVVLRPAFNEDRLVRAKASRLKGLQEINNDPGSIAYYRWTWLLVGKEHPASHLETRAEIDGVTVDDLRRLHTRFVRPENAILGVSGDFRRAEMLNRLDELFGNWPKEGLFTPPVLQLWPVHPEPGVYLLRGDYEQSQVRLGRVIRELTDDSPDCAVAEILSYALGYMRVFYRVRTEGISYGAGVMINVGEDYSTLSGFGSGRGDATLPLLRAMREETQASTGRPFTKEELESARVFRVGIEMKSNETPAALVAGKVGDIMRGRPEEFRERHLQRLLAATGEDLQRAAERYAVPADSMVVLVLGDPAQFGLPLDSLGMGPVKELVPVKFGE